MLRAYKDITDKLGLPLWWDDNGCPRYCVYTPDECGVYDTVSAFLEIACQSCDQRFHVVVAFNRMSWWQQEEHYQKVKKGLQLYPSKDSIGAFHFGDPPIHECLGDTMNCETRRVIQFWEKVNFRWVRKPEYEVIYGAEERYQGSGGGN